MISANLTKKQRLEIYRRDGYRCALCDSTKYIQIHHYIPRGRGGGNHPHNLITLCADCHALVHGMDLRGWGATKEDVEQAIVEYLADYYAPDWSPWKKDRGQALAEQLAASTPDQAAQVTANATWADVRALVDYLAQQEDPAVLRRHGPAQEGPP